MQSPAIAPLPSGPRAHQIKPTRSYCTPHTLLRDAPVEPLPTINPIKTLAAKLCRRENDSSFNAQLVAITHKLSPVAYITGTVGFFSIMALTFVLDTATRTALTCVTCVTSSFVLVYIVASLSWDMLLLLVGTFEFWFLFAINTHNILMWMALFSDQRALAFAAVGAIFATTLSIDANIYTRRFLIRLTVLGSPGLFLVVVATALRLPPDVHYQTFDIVGLRVDILDLLVNGNLIIAYFTAIRVFRCRHLIFSRDPIKLISCDMYFPTCHLIEQQSSRASSVTDSAAPQTIVSDGQLTLLHHSSSRGIDADRTLLPSFARCVRTFWPPQVIAATGAVGLGLTIVGFTLQSMDMGYAKTFPTRYFSTPGLEWSGLACSSIYVVVYASHWQPILVRRIVQEIDVWFVVFQLAVVTLGVSDAFQWAMRPTLLNITAALWCVWVLSLDAVPTATRRRLAFNRWFVIVVIAYLGCVPFVLAYWVFFSPASELIHDQVLFRLRVGKTEFEADLLAFVASKLVTLWIWIGRFLWRELFRPRDAYRLIKRHVFYRVPSC